MALGNSRKTAIRHPNHLVGYPVGLLFVSVIGLADCQFGLKNTGFQQSLDGLIADGLLESQDRVKRSKGRL
jgi:hypothetical protein